MSFSSFLTVSSPICFAASALFPLCVESYFHWHPLSQSHHNPCFTFFLHDNYLNNNLLTHSRCDRCLCPMLIIYILLSLLHFICFTVIIIRYSPLSLANYFRVDTVSIVDWDTHHGTFGALCIKIAFFVVGRGVLVQGFNGWVLVIDLRARFIHVLVKIRAEEGR